jgi:hypothetical protein
LALLKATVDAPADAPESPGAWGWIEQPSKADYIAKVENAEGSIKTLEEQASTLRAELESFIPKKRNAGTGDGRVSLRCPTELVPAPLPSVDRGDDGCAQGGSGPGPQPLLPAHFH